MATNTGGEAEGEERRTGDAGSSSVSAAGGENLWPEELAALVRGLAHALSNRVGTIVAATGMLAPGTPVSAPVVTVLRDEGARLEELLALVRLLGGDGGHAGPEPIHLPDLVAPIVALHAHHAAWRDVPVTVTPDPLAPPVRARHTGLARALLVLLSGAKPAGAAAIAWRGADGGVALDVTGGAPGDARVAAAAARLAGADARATPAGYTLRLPGL